MSKNYWWDLETGPVDDDLLDKLMPEFLPDARLTDEDKIKASVKKKQDEWRAKAALNGVTGKIIAYSCAWDDEEVQFFTAPNEKVLLETLIHDLSTAIGLGGMIFGYNCFSFDLPVVCMRACVHSIPAFKLFTTSYRGRWAWNEAFVDVMQVWCGPYNRPDGMSLKNVALALGVGTKTGTGAEFAELLKNDPVKAKEYALNDTHLLREICRKMGLV